MRDEGCVGEGQRAHPAPREATLPGTGFSESPSSPVPRPSPRITDPQDELFEVLDADGNPTGVAKPRWQVHRDGDWHGALHIWVGGVGDDGEPFVLFQRRSMTKDTWPGALDVAIGGHVRAGETLGETAREGEEEIGLRVALMDLVRIGRRFAAGSGNGVVDREVQEVFAVRSDLRLTAYALHPDEVSAVVAIRIRDALSLFAGESAEMTAIECPRGGEPIRTTVRRSDFAGRDNRYPLVALPALVAVIGGETPEPFIVRVG